MDMGHKKREAFHFQLCGLPLQFFFEHPITNCDHDNDSTCLKKCVRRQIFEGKSSVSPYLLHQYQENNGTQMFFRRQIVSRDTWYIYLFHILTSKVILTMQFT